jgi:hypothetical protein
VVAKGMTREPAFSRHAKN